MEGNDVRMRRWHKECVRGALFASLPAASPIKSEGAKQQAGGKAKGQNKKERHRY
jgi:hypothetical protein